MSFKFAARTILELGKELISSDDVALYELIKNAVDANSSRVEIFVEMHLTNSNYRQAVAYIEEEGKDWHEVVDFVQRSLTELDDSIVENLLNDLNDSSRNKNVLRKLKEFYKNINYIEIRDIGHGMSLDDLTSIFLRIGTHSRRNQNLDGAKNLGDKGIGRLSAMRLGDHLQVKTSQTGEQYWNLLDIDWTRFSHDDDVDAEEINIEPEIGDKKTDIGEHGTIIRISDLRGDWDNVRFFDILQGRISRMIDPFIPHSANRLIVARHNGKRIQIPSIPEPLLRAAHAVCRVNFYMDGHNPVLEGEIDYRHRQRKRKIEARGADVYSLAQEPVKRRAKRGHAAFKFVPVRPSVFKDLGNFSCDIYWYNRRAVVAIEGLTNKVADTRREISNWSGGPMLYRYGFRILPYGDPEDDWLALDEIAFGQKGFKLNRQQVIGRVLIETSHHALGEKTDREGLISSDTFDALRKILTWVMHTEMRGLINEADRIELIERREAEKNMVTVSKLKDRVDIALKRLRERVGDTATTEIDSLSRNVNSLAKQSQDLIQRIEAVIEEADEERGKFVYLAGIGLMTEFIFHELERAVSYTMNTISHGAVETTTIDSLKDQLSTLHKRIAAFDELTGEKRQRKSTFDLGELVGHILENHSREFERHGILIEFEKPSRPFLIKAVRGMMIQILENLIVNSTYWLKQQKRFEMHFYPVLTFVIDSEGKTLMIRDNGPGVIEDRRERIFQPFITTKPTGQGRGLGLYISRDMAEYHGWKLYMDDEVGRVREGRSNTFVLDMSSTKGR